MLNKNIAEFVEQAKKSEAFEKIEITSNGTLLNSHLSDKLIDSGLDTLKISLEAIDEEKFYEIAKVRVDIDELYNNIKYFYDNR